MPPTSDLSILDVVTPVPALPMEVRLPIDLQVKWDVRRVKLGVTTTLVDGQDFLALNGTTSLELSILFNPPLADAVGFLPLPDDNSDSFVWAHVTLTARGTPFSVSGDISIPTVLTTLPVPPLLLCFRAENYGLGVLAIVPDDSPIGQVVQLSEGLRVLGSLVSRLRRFPRTVPLLDVLYRISRRLTRLPLTLKVGNEISNLHKVRMEKRVYDFALEWGVTQVLPGLAGIVEADWIAKDTYWGDRISSILLIGSKGFTAQLFRDKNFRGDMLQISVSDAGFVTSNSLRVVDPSGIPVSYEPHDPNLIRTNTGESLDERISSIRLLEEAPPLFVHLP